MRKIILLFVITSSVKAQFLFDTLYYKKIYDKTLWSIYVNSVGTNFQLKQTFISDTTLKTPLNISAESLQEFGISYANHKQFVMINLFMALASDANKKPKPRYSNAIYSYADRQFLIDVGYNWFNSYYEKNSSNFIKNFNETTPYYDYKKLRSLNAFINYTSFFNYKKFSYRAAYHGTARQTKSAASLLYFINADYNRLESDSAIIPFYVRNSYDKFGQLNRLFNYRLATGIGASGTLVLLKSFYINATGMVAPALQMQQYSLKPTSGFTNKLSVLYIADLRFAIGLNLKQFVISNITLINYQAYKISKVNLSNTLISNRFSIGYRFKTKSRKVFNG